MTWTEGRKLRTVTVDGGSTSYEYGYNGLRSRKNNGDGSYTKYCIVGDRTVGEIRYNANGLITLYIRYLFDETGSVEGLSLWYKGDSDWSNYYFVKNLQGDVLHMYRASDNELVAEYSYDSWGNILSATGELADLNPFRYRGYYYDAETGFYYVSSRYYDPEVGRFISADTTDVLDVQSNLHDKNLYAYCDNNPVMRKDLNGQVWITVGIMAVGGVIGGVIGAVSSAVTQNALTGTINWKSVAVAGGAGFVSGAVAASPLGLGWQMGIGAGIGAASYLADCGVNKKSAAVDELIVATAGGLASGYIGGPGANQHMALTRTIQTSIKTTTRMSTRKATTYAAKQIASTKAWRNNVLTVNAMGSSARFAAGTGFSNALAGAWTTVKGWFSKLFK